MRHLTLILALSWYGSTAWSEHVDLISGRVLYVPFEGLIEDQSGNMHSVAATGAVGFSTGVLGMAADFNGTQSVTFPSVSDTYLSDSAFTLAFWFRIDQAPLQNYSLIAHRDLCGFDDFLDVRPGATSINMAMVQPTTLRYVVSGSYTLGTWHHYAATHDGQELRLYLDGVVVDMVATDPTAFSIANPLGISVSPCIGIDGTQPYVGSLDELVLYDRALSDEEAAALAAGHIFTDGFETPD